MTRALLAAVLLACLPGARAATPAFYDVCKGQLGDLRFSNRQADGKFVVRCPDGKIELEIANCTGSLTLDNSYNAVIACRQHGGKRYPVIRGPYPR